MCSFKTNVKGAKLLGGFRVEPEVYSRDELNQHAANYASADGGGFASLNMRARQYSHEVESESVEPCEDKHSKADV